MHFRVIRRIDVIALLFRFQYDFKEFIDGSYRKILEYIESCLETMMSSMNVHDTSEWTWIFLFSLLINIA
jgi:hypothetical protein